MKNKNPAIALCFPSEKRMLNRIKFLFSAAYISLFMEISEELVRKVAELACLELSDEEVKKFAKELEEIEKAFSKIREVDTENCEPAFHPVKIENVWREDTPSESLSREVALANTQHKEDGYFKGPKIV